PRRACRHRRARHRARRRRHGALAGAAMIEVGLAVGASVGWGASEFVAGVAARKWPVIVVLAGSQLASLLLVGGFVLASGTLATPGDAVWLALAAGVFEVAGFAALYRALASGPMGPVAPVAALGGLVPLSVSLAEGGSLATTSAVGIVLGLAGIVLVSWDEDDQPRALTLPLVLAGLASLCFGMFFLLLGRASHGGGALEAVAYGRVAAVAVTAPLLLVALHRARARARERSGRRPLLSPADLATIVAVGVLDVGANVLYATSTSRSTEVGVQIVASACPVATVLLARIVLKERLSVIQGVGVWLTICAVLLIGGG
ncbi:MAG: DMT family transporter, partial [Solirubrobacteraceae bacterium]|nr:DMT family transporter [Solirubrobacteraceae bacterium]